MLPELLEPEIEDLPKDHFYLTGDKADQRAEAILEFMGEADFVFGYDRTCTGLCVKFAQYLTNHTNGIVTPIGMQGAMLRALGLPQEDATKESLFLERVVLNKETENEVAILRLSRGSLAVTRAFGYGNMFSEFLAGLAEHNPIKWVAKVAYKEVKEHKHQIPSKDGTTCAIPNFDPENQNKRDNSARKKIFAGVAAAAVVYAATSKKRRN